MGANTNDAHVTNILYTARIEVLIGGIVVKVMVVHSVCNAHKLISVGNSCKKLFSCLYSPFNQLPLTLTDILKPNRRYNLPFGRLDRDVVEGRRDLLQNYLRVRSSKLFILFRNCF